MLGSIFNKLSKHVIKTSNVTEYIDLDIQNTEAPSNNNLICMIKHINKVHLKELLKIFKWLASSDIHTIIGWLDLFFNLFTKRERE